MAAGIDSFFKFIELKQQIFNKTKKSGGMYVIFVPVVCP